MERGYSSLTDSIGHNFALDQIGANFTMSDYLIDSMHIFGESPISNTISYSPRIS